MSIAAPGSARYLVPPFPVRRFSVDEYQRMCQVGILTEDDKVELLDGWITPKTSRNPPHDSHLDQVADALRARLPAGWRTRVQSAVTLSASVPEPDVAVVPGPASRYRAHHPVPADVALLVEVADTSLDHDRHTKGPLYAQAGIAAYWIVNLVDRVVEVYSDPVGSAYQHRQDCTLADVVPLTLPGHAAVLVPVVELLG